MLGLYNPLAMALTILLISSCVVAISFLTCASSPRVFLPAAHIVNHTQEIGEFIRRSCYDTVFVCVDYLNVVLIGILANST